MTKIKREMSYKIYLDKCMNDPANEEEKCLEMYIADNHVVVTFRSHSIYIPITAFDAVKNCGDELISNEEKASSTAKSDFIIMRVPTAKKDT